MKVFGFSFFEVRPSNFCLLFFSLLSIHAIAQKNFQVQDSTKADRNMYGDLLNDDTKYNQTYPLWKPIIEVVGINNATWLIDRYLFNYDWSYIDKESWRSNLHGRWEWDNDRFGINFLGHPYSGTMYFNAGRSQGYNFWQSIPFTIEGSLMWEYFGERTKPSYNDIINTPVNGVFFGEILYRLSSNILDDRTAGSERTWREIAAGLVNPVRGINRLLQGKTRTITKQEVYEKEPVNLTLWTGVDNRGGRANYFSEIKKPIFSFQFDYGNPFEDRKRKPFDLFRFRLGLHFGDGRKILDQATGYGILFGKNIKKDSPSILTGGFQYYDYFDNNSFELAAIGLGFGTIARFDLKSPKKSNFFLGLHLGIVPLSGTSEDPDTASEVRDYNFGNGLLGKLEATLNLWERFTGRLVASYYYIHQSVHGIGNSFIGVLQPNISIRIRKNLHVGYEESLYLNDRYFRSGLSAQHLSSREEKIYIQFYLEDRQRRGKYH
jgi:hypothetical protein